MNKNSFYKKRIFPVIFMFCITAFYIFILAIVYLYTKDRIMFKESLALKKALLSASGIDIPLTEKIIEELYNDRIMPFYGNDDRVKYYIIKSDSGTNSGYLIINNGAGLWGTITAVLGFENDLLVVSLLRSCQVHVLSNKK